MRSIQYLLCAVFSLATLSQANGQTTNPYTPTFYHCELDVKVPLYPKEVGAEWKGRKDTMTKWIGKITPAPTKESNGWRNSAKTVDELFQDAVNTAPHFRQKCEEMAKKADCKTFFGKSAGIKKKSGLVDKVGRLARKHKISKAQAVTTLNDSVRSTLIAQTPEQIKKAVAAIKELATELKCKVVFQNIWETDRASGYVGVHGTVLFPVFDAAGNQIKGRNILTEIQIHLQCIVDGTDKCPKEQAHRIYEKERAAPDESKVLLDATKLIFLEGLRKCPVNK